MICGQGHEQKFKYPYPRASKIIQMPYPRPKRDRSKFPPYAPPPPRRLDIDRCIKLLRGGGIGGGFDSSHCPVVGTFDRFNGLSRNILLTFSCYFDDPQMPCGGAFELKLSAQFKCPAYARPPPPPSSLTLIGA